MELTISIKEEQKLSFLVKLLQELDFIEILEIKDTDTLIPQEHIDLLVDRLKRIERNETSFRSWDLIKKQYTLKERNLRF